MSTMKGMDGFLAFLAGAGTGIALARLLPGDSWTLSKSPGGILEMDPGRQSSVSASIGRVHSLLGEIRGLMRNRESSRHAGTSHSGLDYGPRRPSVSDGAGKSRHPDDSWRRPDQIGYGPERTGAAVPPSGDRAALIAFLAGTAAMAAGVASVMVAARREGPGAAWPAAGGLLAAAALVAWRRGAQAAGSRRSGSAVPAMPGPRGMRKGRPAIP